MPKPIEASPGESPQPIYNQLATFQCDPAAAGEFAELYGELNHFASIFVLSFN